MRIGSRIVRLESCSSTNDIAKDLAEKGEPEGTVVIASEQTRGRGRLARSWFSSRNMGLYASLLLRPPEGGAALLTLMGGVALCQAVRESFRIQVCLKWPNDLIWKGRKLGGILCESSFTGSRLEYLVLGFGLNIRQEKRDFPQSLRETATSLKQIIGSDPDRDLLLFHLWNKLDYWYYCFLNGQQSDITTAFLEESCFLIGETLEIDTPEGPLAGRFCGIGPHGGLILETAGKRVTYFAAEPRSLPAPEEK